MKKSIILLLIYTAVIGLVLFIGRIVYEDRYCYIVTRKKMYLGNIQQWWSCVMIEKNGELQYRTSEFCRYEAIDSLLTDQDREVKIFILNLKQLSNGHK